MTVGEFKRMLQDIPEHYELTFGIQQFNQIKRHGDTRVDVVLWPLFACEASGEYYTVPDERLDR